MPTGTTFDTLLELRAVGDAAETATSTETIVDMGDAEFRADLVIDVTAIDVANGNEHYQIIFELSSSATFASTIVSAAQVDLGDQSVIVGNSDVDSTTGKIVLGVTNNVSGTVYRYVRLANVIAGTSPSIDYNAHLAIQGTAAG